MDKKRLVLIGIVLFLLFSSPGLAGENTGIPCTSDQECFDLFSSSSYYCDLTVLACFQGVNNNINSSVGSPTGSLSSNSQALLPNATPVVSTPPTELILTRSPTVTYDELQNRVVALEQEIQQLQQQITDSLNQIITIEGNLQTLTTKQAEVKAVVDQKLTSVSTGLAVLQQNVDFTKSELDSVQKSLAARQARNQVILIIVISLVVLGAGGIVGYYLLRNRQPTAQVDHHIVDYISSHIRQGRKFPQIKANLLKAGWQSDQIEWAYKETLKHNYQKYQTNGQPASPNRDTIKIVSVIVVSLLLLGGIFFLVKGVTGKAIHFQRVQDLETAAKNLLTSRLPDSPLFSLVDFATVCTEIQDQEKMVSYEIVKTPLGQEVNPKTCSSDYDLVLHFNSFESFNSLARDLSCENIKKEHQLKGFYVYPSKYVLSGFQLNPTQDAVKFCKVLSACLSLDEIESIGISC